MVKAAVLRERGRPLEVCEIVRPDPGPEQVRIRLVAAVVRPSDLSPADGTLRTATTDLTGIDGAFEDLRRGHGARTVVRPNGRHR